MNKLPETLIGKSQAAQRLVLDASVRHTCKRERRAERPSAPTSSRAFQEPADRRPIDRSLETLFEHNFDGRIIDIVGRAASPAGWSVDPTISPSVRVSSIKASARSAR